MSFNFKKFTVEDDKSTMKVGTDAVLLGVWTAIHDAGTILDIGTGSGIIALMMAQRSGADIWAIDIDQDSAIQAGFNFNNSPWPERLQSEHTSLLEYSPSHKFDLILSNPPYFVNQLRSPKARRNISGHNVHLDFDELILHSVRLLKPNGHLALILPPPEAEQFTAKALMYSLYVNRRANVLSKPGREAVRVLIEFSGERYNQPESEEICIRNADDSWHSDYLRLTKDFYLFA